MTFASSVRSQKSGRVAPIVGVALLWAAALGGCQSPGMPLSQNLKPTLAAPECPRIGGIYELYGEALPGTVDFYRNRNARLTLNAMLGVPAKPELIQGAERVEVLHEDTLELVNRHDGMVAAHQLDLQPEDRVTCQPNQITIQRMRFEGTEVPEPVRLVSTTEQELTVERDGNLLVRTRIVNHGKSFFFDTPVPPEEYAARFKRLF